MIGIILANICSFGAMVADSFSASRKARKDMLLMQCVSQMFYLGTSLLLKSYSATVQNAMAICRNAFAAYNIKNKPLEYFFIIAPVVLGIYFNNRGFIGYLPIIANLVFSYAMFSYPNEPRKLKIAFSVMAGVFTVYDFALLDFVAGISNIVAISTAIITLRADAKNANKAHE